MLLQAFLLAWGFSVCAIGCDMHGIGGCCNRSGSSFCLKLNGKHFHAAEMGQDYMREVAGAVDHVVESVRCVHDMGIQGLG